MQSLGKTQKDVASSAGMSRQTLNTKLSREKLTEADFYKIGLAMGLDKNKLTASASRPRQDSFFDVKSQANGAFLTELVQNEDETPFFDLGNGYLIMYVPLIQQRAYASYMQGFSDPEYLEEMPKHSLMVTKQHRGRYVAVEVEGDSMTDGTMESIPEGATVTGREIQKHHWRSPFHIHRFKDYIIHHADGIIIKRIVKHDVEAGTITCHSLNADFSDFELNLNDCKEIFNIVDVSTKR